MWSEGKASVVSVCSRRERWQGVLGSRLGRKVCASPAPGPGGGGCFWLAVGGGALIGLDSFVDIKCIQKDRFGLLIIFKISSNCL